MRSSRSVPTRCLAVTAVLGLSLATAAPAMAAGRGATLLRDGFTGSSPLTVPAPGGGTVANPDATQVFDGIPPGGAPWVLDDNSRVRVREDGRIRVVVRHLVIPGRDPGNPAPLMVASLLCDGALVDSTVAFPVTPDGTGRVADRIAVPADCDDPRVLVRNAAPAATNPLPDGHGAYFAFTTGGDDHH